MATLMPPRLAAITQEHLDGESVMSALRPWRRRLSLQQVLRWTLWGIIMGLLVACFVLLLARITPWSNASVWAIGLAIVSTISALGMALWRQPSLSHTARVTDRSLSLHDRLSTAWELRDQSVPLAKLQRHDALKQLQKHTPAKTLSLRPHRSTALFFLLIAICFVLLLVLPNPMTAALKQQAAFQARIAKQIASIEQVRQNLTPGISPTEQQKIAQILSNLENKLQQAKTETQAQQALAQAQAQLNQQRNPQANNNAQANAAASSALQNSTNANLKALGNALAGNDSKQVSKELQKLGGQINKLSPQQRTQVAQQLENAANQANQNQALSSALHQAAKAVADGNQSEVNDAATAMQAASAENAATQAKENSINHTAQSLQQVANNLAASTDGSNNQNQGQTQQAQSQLTQGQKAQQEQGQGEGQGLAGQGQQAQPEQSQGQGQGQGQGTGSSSGNNRTGNSKNEQVTIPGQISSGSSTQSADNNTGIVQTGDSVPYSQVIQQYNQMAHDEIDNSNISSDQKDLVHNYFNQLEGH